MARRSALATYDSHGQGIWLRSLPSPWRSPPGTDLAELGRRPSKRVTKGLDFLHARQQTSGGFGTMATTAWGILGAVASGERMGSSLWTVAGKNPYSYLQANDHQAAAASDANAPVYYSRAIMSYVAVGHVNEVFQAGTPSTDLLAKLYSYQDFIDGSATKGRFSALASIPTLQAVHTTAWAILAMQAVGARDQVRFGPAVTWLAGQQNSTDGGFPATATGQLERRGHGAGHPGAGAGVAAGVSVPAIVGPGCPAYLKGHQQIRRRVPLRSRRRHRRHGHLRGHPGHHRRGRAAGATGR